MALTFRRWLALALFGCAIAAVIVLRDRPRQTHEWTTRDRLRERANDARLRATQAAELLRRVRLRDSVTTALRGIPGAAVQFDRALDSTTRHALASLSAQAAERLPATPVVAAQVAFVLDTIVDIRGQRRLGFAGSLVIDYVLPSPATSGRCVVIARVRSVTQYARRFAELRSDITRRRLPGPCAFYAAFGHPGPYVSEWLQARGFAFAQNGDWTSADPWVAPDWFTGRSQFLAIYDLVNQHGVACAMEDDGACLMALTDPGVSGRLRPYRDSMVSAAEYNPFLHGDRIWVTGGWSLGAREWTLLADMARTLGPERFGAFWRSTRPVPDAFQAAAGRSLASWTREWISTTYRIRDSRQISAAGLGSGTLVILLAVALSIVAARRRVVA